MPEREPEGVSGAAGPSGLGSIPDRPPTPLDWLIGIGAFYALAILPVAMFFLAAIGVPVLILECHMGLFLLPRVGWDGWPWFLLPYGIVGAFLPRARRHRPILCGLLVAIWIVEGALLVLYEIALGA